ncbi:unnamed protein product [Oikopleura dioica]|uniref:Uncharacterized protein n=1 Tax=Oikopleura dioica TaxID=34765 RepID=E4XHY2_OIKDI|nr:unnamed protein product [Oikopleura dioica]
MADDPFASSNRNGGDFENDPFASGNDPFGSGEDPFATPPVDPFNGVLIDFGDIEPVTVAVSTADPFATTSDPFATSDDIPDPFGDDPFSAAPMPSTANNGTSQNTSDPWGSAFGNSDSTFVNSRSTATFGFDSTPAQPEKKVAPARPPPARPAPSRPPPPGGL